MTVPSGVLSRRALKRALVDIQDEDATARFEAATLLSHDPAAFTTLCSLLRTVTRPEIRHPIVYALNWQTDLRGWAIFVKILRDQHESAAVRAQAAEGLAYMFHRKRKGTRCFHSAIELLTTSLADPSADVRYYSAFALGASGERTAVPALRQAAKDRATSNNFVGTVGHEARDALKRIEPAAA